MPCGCKGQAAQGRPTYQVVATSGKVVFTSPSKPTAEAVGRRYPNSEVRTVDAKKPVPVNKSTT